MNYRGWVITVWVAAPEDWDADAVYNGTRDAIADNADSPLGVLAIYTPKEDTPEPVADNGNPKCSCGCGAQSVPAGYCECGQAMPCNH